ncbi:hypothetical protein BVRB_5g103550 [Beta vulgaris subsp. vulgaris]|nr:hypothetical protein BVRB_5g103550 [Beta vulgaris subsp. vulgaris]
MDEGQSQFVPPHAQVVLDLDPEEELDRCEDDQAGTQTCNNQTSTTKKNRKQTSEAWEYFNRIEVDGVVKAQYGLDVISCGIVKVRECVSFWMSTPKRIEKFEEAKEMLEKFDNYWKNINGILAVATILDPRNKMDCVEYYFGEIYDGEADLEIARVRKILDKLVVEYQKKSVGLNSEEPPKGASGGNVTQPSSKCQEDRNAQSKKTKKRKVSGRYEVDHYIEDEPLPEDDEFDILYWWKKDIKYPTLRMIAKDILAIPVSTMASESALSMGGRVVSPHRSRLACTTVEALICLQNWMMEDTKGKMEGTHACSTINDDSDV